MCWRFSILCPWIPIFFFLRISSCFMSYNLISPYFFGFKWYPIVWSWSFSEGYHHHHPNCHGYSCMKVIQSSIFKSFEHHVHFSTLPCLFPLKLTIPHVIGLCFEFFQCHGIIKNMDIALQGGYQLGYVLTHLFS